jgi:hypothetical protein
MSQAVIDFCEGLKSTLLAVEDRLGKAKNAIDASAAEVSAEAKKHVDEAAEQLAAFRAHAGVMAEAIRADLPQQTAAARDKLGEFGQEAQVAMRHAIVFLAETAAKGAEGAASGLGAGAKAAHRLAEGLRHDTALTVVEAKAETPVA